MATALAGSKKNKKSPSKAHKQPVAVAPPVEAPEVRHDARPGYCTFWNRSPWKWLVSLKIGLTLLVVLTIASTVGTLIDPLERAQAVIYYSWWYKLLLLALAVNMSFATVQTVCKKVLPTRRLHLHSNPGFFDLAKPAASCAFDGTVEQVAAEFRRQGCQVLVDGNAGVARRGWIGRLGGPVSHVGLVTVLLAGFVSSWVAGEGWVRIQEGRSVDTFTLRDGENTQMALGYTLALDDFSTGFFPRTRVPSHFQSMVTATAGGQVLYSGPVEVNHSPKINGWRLHQTSYEELRGVTRQTVKVVPPAEGAEPITVEVTPGKHVPVPGLAGTSLLFQMSGAWSVIGESGVIASGSLAHNHGDAFSVKVERYEPDFVLGADKQIMSRSEYPNNPAIQVTLLSDGQPAARQWIFGRADMRQFSHNANAHFQMEFLDSRMDGEKTLFTIKVIDGHTNLPMGIVELALGEEKDLEVQAAPAEAPADNTAGWSVEMGAPVTAYATVLSLSRNPILPAAYIGCGLMMLGLMIGFFIRRREVWFLVDPEARQLRVAAHYRHRAEELDCATTSILTKLSAAKS